MRFVQNFVFDECFNNFAAYFSHLNTRKIDFFRTKIHILRPKDFFFGKTFYLCPLKIQGYNEADALRNKGI